MYDVFLRLYDITKHAKRLKSINKDLTYRIYLNKK